MAIYSGFTQVDLPINSMVIFHSYVNVYQRVTLESLVHPNVPKSLGNQFVLIESKRLSHFHVLRGLVLASKENWTKWSAKWLVCTLQAWERLPPTVPLTDDQGPLRRSFKQNKSGDQVKWNRQVCGWSKTLETYGHFAVIDTHWWDSLI